MTKPKRQEHGSGFVNTAGFSYYDADEIDAYLSRRRTGRGLQEAEQFVARTVNALEAHTPMIYGALIADGHALIKKLRDE